MRQNISAWAIPRPATIPTQIKDVVLRPLRRGDRRAWDAVIDESWHWLRPWEPTTEITVEPQRDRWRFQAVYDAARRDVKKGSRLLLAITHVDGQILGCISANNVVWGPLCGCSVGYWTASQAAGQGIMPAAVRALLTFLFEQSAMHRVEICIRPENAASLRVVQKLGIPHEGYRRAFLHIDGDWRDHEVFVALREDWPYT